MGSVSASAIIISLSFFVAFAVVYSASMDTQFNLNKAMEERERLDRNYYDSSIRISAVHVSATGTVIVINNTGKTVLNPYYMTFLLNGKWYSVNGITVEGKNTSIWLPGEKAVFILDYSGVVKRVKAINEFGSCDYYTS